MKRPKGPPAEPPRQGLPRQGSQARGPLRQGPRRQGSWAGAAQGWPRQGPAVVLGGGLASQPEPGPPRVGLPGRGLPGRGLLGAFQADGFQAQAEAGCPIRGKLLGCLPGQALGSSGRRWGSSGRGPERPHKRRLLRFTEGLGYLILGRPDGFLASDLPGPPRSPQLPAGLELRRPPEGFWLRSYLACRLRCVRPARRPRAHSV